MAQINQDVIVITISTLTKDGVDGTSIASDEMLTTLEEVVQGLVGDGAIVEVTAGE